METIADYWPYAAALLPTVGVAFLFYWIIRYMIEADRSERKALAKWNADNAAAAEKSSASGPADRPFEKNEDSPQKND